MIKQQEERVGGDSDLFHYMSQSEEGNLELKGNQKAAK